MKSNVIIIFGKVNFYFYLFNIVKIRDICDQLWENWAFRAKTKFEIQLIIGQQHEFMDFLTINSPVSIDTALSLSEVSTHLTSAFTPSESFESFNSLSDFQNGFNSYT